jgi:hypothetical protein
LLINLSVSWKKNSSVVQTFLVMYLFTVLSGALRKWVFAGSVLGNIIFLVQIFIPYFFYFSDKEGVKKVFENKILTLFFIALLLLAANPLNKTIFHGLLGVILHFGFWFMSFYYLQNRNKFNFSNTYLFLSIAAIAQFLLCNIQYQLPADHLLNTYANTEIVGGVATTASAVRVSGTFSFLSGLVSFLAFHTFFVCVLIKKQFNPSWVVVLIVFGLVVSFMNASRSGTYFFVALVGAYLVLEGRKTKLLSTLSRLTVPVIFVYAFFLIKGDLGVASNITQAYDNFDERSTALREAGEESGRFESYYKDIFIVNGSYKVFGVGLGATYQGATQLFGTSDYIIEFFPLEGENGRIICEGGYFLFILKVIMTIVLCLQFKFPFTLKLIAMGLLIFLQPTVFNIYNSIFLFMGFAMLDNSYYRDSNEMITNKPLSFLAQR